LFTRLERLPCLRLIKSAVVPLSKTLREPTGIRIIIIAFMHARVRPPSGNAVVESHPVTFTEALAEASPESAMRIGQVGSRKYPEAKIIGFRLGGPQGEQPKDCRNENEKSFHEVQSLRTWTGRTFTYSA
jgi:hypothetical protein